MNPYRIENCECSNTCGMSPFKARFCYWKANAITCFITLLAMGWMTVELTRIFAESYRRLAIDCRVDAGVEP